MIILFATNNKMCREYTSIRNKNTNMKNTNTNLQYALLQFLLSDPKTQKKKKKRQAKLLEAGFKLRKIMDMKGHT